MGILIHTLFEGMLRAYHLGGGIIRMVYKRKAVFKLMTITCDNDVTN